ncbi:MAG: ATP-dependent RNA helicase HrpA, partial [Paraburkholderia sp.]|nr:ATP-dependent RNA helicase HrpA [Paraburkholderia sp.]
MSNVPKRPASAQGGNTPAGKDAAQGGAQEKRASQKYGDGAKLASADRLAALVSGGARNQRNPQNQQQAAQAAGQKSVQPAQALEQAAVAAPREARTESQTVTPASAQPQQRERAPQPGTLAPTQTRAQPAKPQASRPPQTPPRTEPQASQPGESRHAAQSSPRRDAPLRNPGAQPDAARNDQRTAQRGEPRAPRNQAPREQRPKQPKQPKPVDQSREPHPSQPARAKSAGASRPANEGERAQRAERQPRAPREPREPRAPRAPIEPNPIPPITFPEALPVSGRREEIARAIAENQVVIVSGETGSGKTTQLPKIALSLGRGRGAGGTGLIGHTQPRRIAASATGRRIAEELGTPFGEVVGSKVRFTDNLAPGASVKLMTDGILLAETQTDPLLKAYDTIIIDEAHERSLNIDFLLGYLKEILPRRPDLKLIVTSATIDADRFARHFGSEEKPAPVIEVSGRLYPVEVRYRAVQEDSPAVKNAQGTAPRESRKSQRDTDRDLMDAIVDAVDELCREGSGDVLVFLPGEREIRDAAEALRKHHPPHTEILPLFARLSAQEQERVFKPSNARRIVLATNVAETSLTVPGIRYVVDTGLARVKRYSYRNKVEQLQIESISQAAANQRAGRCGRVADGVCIRLYEEQDFLSRPKFSDPEILRSSLAAVILRMKSLHLTAIETFPFIEPPPGRAIADGYQLLNELGAVDDDNALTQLGRELARLPLDPRVGRMILAARDEQAMREVLIIASALSVQDPRDRPIEAQEQADQAHRRFADERSEFLQWLKIWAWFEEAVAHKKSNKQLVDSCRANFLSHLRLREWRDVHSQLLTVVREHGWRINEADATYEQIHHALLTGLLGNIGLKADDDPHYLGARGIKFHLWPGSALVKKAGRWIVAAELIETSRLYARCIAKIEPEWLEKVGAHLLRKSLSEPHWEKRAAQVSAFERGVLYGLPVYQRRRVAFGKQDPARARELFIRGALVEGEFDTKLAFFAHNRKLLADIEQLEHKSRRQDVLVDDELIFAFYDQAIPEGIYSGASFERWYRDEVKKGGQPEDKLRLLYLSRDDL